MSVISLSSDDEDDCIILESEEEQEVLEDSFKVFVADDKSVCLEPLQSPSSEIYVDVQTPGCEDLDPLAEVENVTVKESSICNNDEMPTYSNSNSSTEYESILPDDNNYLNESENVGATLNSSTRIEEPSHLVKPKNVTVETLQNNNPSIIPNNNSDNLKYIAERLAEVLTSSESTKRKPNLADAQEATILEVSRESFSILQYENRFHGKHTEKTTSYARATSEKNTRKRKQGLRKNKKLTGSFDDPVSYVSFLEEAQNQTMTNEEVIMNPKKRRGRRKKVGLERSLKPTSDEGPINNFSTLHKKPKKQSNSKKKINTPFNHLTKNQSPLNQENQINNLDEVNNKLRFTFDRRNSTVSVSFVSTTQNHKSDLELQSNMQFDQLEAISKLENSLLLAHVGSQHSQNLISKIEKETNFGLVDISQLKVGFVQIYKQIFDEPAEILCKNMGDLLLIVMKEFRTYQTRKESASRLTCEQLKNHEIKMAYSYYNNTVKKYAKAFESYFGQMWLKILHAKICTELCRALLVALFLKIFLYISTIATEFSDKISEAKDNVKDLLAQYSGRSVLVKLVFWANATDFERDCWIVLDLMQECLDDPIVEQSLQVGNSEQPIAITPSDKQVNNMISPTTTEENHCSNNIIGEEIINNNAPELQRECLVADITETTIMSNKNNSLDGQVDTPQQTHGIPSASMTPALLRNLNCNAVSVIVKSGPIEKNKPGTCNGSVSTSVSDTAVVGTTTDIKEPLTNQPDYRCSTTPNISAKQYEEMLQNVICNHLGTQRPRTNGPISIEQTASVSSATGSTIPEVSDKGRSTEVNSQQCFIKQSVYSKELKKQGSILLESLTNPAPNVSNPLHQQRQQQVSKELQKHEIIPLESLKNPAPNVPNPLQQQRQQQVTTDFKSQLLERSSPAVPSPSTTQSTSLQPFRRDQYQPSRSQTSSFNLPAASLHSVHSSHLSNTRVTNNMYTATNNTGNSQFSSNGQTDLTSTSGLAAPEDLAISLQGVNPLKYDNRSRLQRQQPLMNYGQSYKNAATNPYYRPQANTTKPYSRPTNYSYQKDRSGQYSYVNSNTPYAYNQLFPPAYNPYTNRYMTPPPPYNAKEHFRGPLYHEQECFGGKRDVRMNTFVNSGQEGSVRNTAPSRQGAVYVDGPPNNPIHAGVTINNFNITTVLPPVSTILRGSYTTRNDLYSAPKDNPYYGQYPSSVPEEHFSYPEAGGPQQTHYHNPYKNTDPEQTLDKK